MPVELKISVGPIIYVFVYGCLSPEAGIVSPSSVPLDSLPRAIPRP